MRLKVKEKRENEIVKTQGVGKMGEQTRGG